MDFTLNSVTTGSKVCAIEAYNLSLPLRAFYLSHSLS
jgi:hypothetical protein